MPEVYIRDSTLREGVELPGIAMGVSDRLEIARFLDGMGVPEMEIGMPYGLRECLPLAEAVKTEGLRIQTSALILSYSSRLADEISVAAESQLDRVEMLFPSSDILLSIRNYHGIDKSKLATFVGESVSRARRTLPRLGVGFVDSTRTDGRLLGALVRAAQDAGADRAIIYDTTGVATPGSMTRLIASVRAMADLPLIAHCHNDFGLATANSLAGIEAGACGVDVVSNGLGDRGGNACLEEVVVALEVLHQRTTGLRLEKICALSRLVEQKTGYKKPPVKPIVGDFVFLHSPVMHIRNAASGNQAAFEPFAPELVGAERRYAFNLPVDYTPALVPFFEELGLAMPAEELTTRILKELAQASDARGLTGADVLKIIEAVAGSAARSCSA